VPVQILKKRPDQALGDWIWSACVTPWRMAPNTRRAVG
jgi:hypothetical protein